MYCANCGIRLPDAARFCDECGARQRSQDERSRAPRLASDAAWSAARPSPPPQPEPWEYCDIVVRERLFGCKRFVAQVTGPAGVRSLAERPMGFFGCDPGFIAGKTIEEMVAGLVADGWEPQPKGAAWYSHRFRRRVSS